MGDDDTLRLYALQAAALLAISIADDLIDFCTLLEAAGLRPPRAFKRMAHALFDFGHDHRPPKEHK